MNHAADAFMAIFGMKRVKPKKCKVCRAEFHPRATMQIVCGARCAAEYAKKQREKIGRESAKKERAEARAKKEKLKTRSDWAKEAQAAVNAFVRERDRDQPCISCGRMHHGQWHAGHYLSRGAHPELAYEPLNIHRQCAPCNTHLSGNQINFRKGLIGRIGIASVEWLEGPHEQTKHTIDDLKEIKAMYMKKLRHATREKK
jgi:hypothetical protein